MESKMLLLGVAMGAILGSVLFALTGPQQLYAEVAQVPLTSTSTSAAQMWSLRSKRPTQTVHKPMELQADVTSSMVTDGASSAPGSARLSGALAAVLGCWAAAWAVARRPSRPRVLDDLDAERCSFTMAAATGKAETTYHFLVANAKFMLFDEEHAMELLREKRRFLREKGMPQDFWVVPSPEFLSNFPELDKRVIKPACALVSTDEKWILFMKLRYDRVLTGSFQGPSDIKKALGSKGGDPLAELPTWTVPAEAGKTIPYPHYAADWFHPFLVGAPAS